VDGRFYSHDPATPNLLDAMRNNSVPATPEAVKQAIAARGQRGESNVVELLPRELERDIETLKTESWPAFAAITDSALGEYDLDALAAKDSEFRDLRANGDKNGDRTDARFNLAKCLAREWPQMNVREFAAILAGLNDEAGEKFGVFVDDSMPSQNGGEYNYRNLARDFARGAAQGRKVGRLTDGAAFGAVEGEDDEDEAAQERRQPGARLKSIGDFCAEYAPVEYVVDGIIERGKLYTLTARTGGGKTSLLSSLSLAVAAGRSDILGLEGERGRAVYCTFENPDDFRAKLIAAMQAHEVSAASVAGRFDIIDAHMGPAAIAKLLREAGGEPYAVVVIDTLQAAFTGANSNDNDEAKKFIMQFRKLRSLPGKPATLIAAHPIKSATKETLVPYGGGAVLNEIDGNLTLWREGRGSIVELHWLGKFRGMDFPPKFFQLESHETSLLDAKGRRLKLPVVRAKTGDQATERALIERREAISGDAAIIAAILAQPGGSLTDWGLATDTKKSTLRARLVRMAGDGLVRQEGAAWTVRPKGRRLLEEARSDVERDGAPFEAVDEDET